MFTKKEIYKKTKQIENTTLQLKKEFVGIDNVIDEIMNKFKLWYLYPETFDKPMTIPMVGMTGCGKTSLINRIVELMDLQLNYKYYNLGEVSNIQQFEFEYNTSQNIFAFDELQYAATLTKDGLEDTKISAQLKSFWELIDTGYFKQLPQYTLVGDMTLLKEIMHKLNSIQPLEIKKGRILNLNANTNFDILDRYELNILNKYTSIPPTQLFHSDDTCNNFINNVKNMEYFFVYYIIENFMNMLKNNNESKDNIEKLISFNSFEDLIKLIDKIISIAKKGELKDMRQSLIFIMANIDEAYNVADSMDPDMSADQFYNLTKNINIVDIKEALQNRFRNEQISRLGNDFIIYPAFNSDSYKKLIKLNLNNYSKSIKEKFKINIEYDESIHSIIYKEGVFPSQGTRPVISTIQSIIKSKLPHVIQYMYDNNFKSNHFIYSFKDNMFICTYLNSNNKPITQFSTNGNLKIENIRKNTNIEKQSLVAVHESGHFVIYSKLYGKMPEKLCSSTVAKSSEGFMLTNIQDYDKFSNYESLKYDIMVALGGYCAEKLIFGDNKLSCGASGDINSATNIAMSMITKYGMHNQPITAIPKAVNQSHNVTTINHEHEQQAIEFINHCCEEVNNIFKDSDWLKMLLNSASYLSENDEMKQETMKTLYEQVPESKRNNHYNEHFYENKLKLYINSINTNHSINNLYAE